MGDRGTQLLSKFRHRWRKFLKKWRDGKYQPNSARLVPYRISWASRSFIKRHGIFNGKRKAQKTTAMPARGQCSNVVHLERERVPKRTGAYSSPDFLVEQVDSDNCLVALNASKTVGLEGYGSLLVIWGQVSLNGARLGCCFHSFCSSSRSSRLGLVCDTCTTHDAHTKSGLLHRFNLGSSIITRLSAYGGLVLWRKQMTRLIWSLQDWMKLFSSELKNQPFVVTDPREPGTQPVLTFDFASPLLNTLKDCTALSSPPVIFLCGGKNSGKSSLGRYLVNILLERYGNVIYADCDPGQTEFNPPGMVAVHLVKEPILSPPYLHQQQPEKMMCIGESSPQESPAHYLSCCQRLATYIVKLQAVQASPVIVNTMGWVKGIGMKMLLDLIRFFQPSDIVVLHSWQTFDKQALDSLSSAVIDCPGLVTAPQQASARDDMSQLLPPSHQQFHYLSSPTHLPVEIGAYSAAELRSMSTVSYFIGSSTLPYPIKLSWRSLKPYVVHISDITIFTGSCQVDQDQTLALLNASLVGLIPKDAIAPEGVGLEMLSGTRRGLRICRGKPCIEVIGLGFVRNICVDSGHLCILTPIPPELWLTVGGIICTSLEVPNLFYGQGTSSPYVAFARSNHIIGSRKLKMRKNLRRSYLPYRRHPV